MNDLVLHSFGGSIEAMKAAAGQMLRTVSQVNVADGRAILKLHKRTGGWSFGSNNTVVDRRDVWAINPASLKHGYIAFEESGDLAQDEDGNNAEVVSPYTMPLPDFDRLPELKAPRSKRDAMAEWKFQMSMDLVCIEGVNKGAEVAYKPTSQGGLRAVRKIVEEIARRILADDSDLVAVIELGFDSYEHKTRGEILTPELFILEWAGLDVETFAPAAPSEKPEKSPKKGDDTRQARSEKTAKGHDVDTRKGKRDTNEGRSDDTKDEPRGRRSARDEDEDGDDRSARSRERRDDAEDDKPSRKTRSDAGVKRGAREDRDDDRRRPREDADPEDDRPAREQGRGRNRRDEPVDEPEVRAARSRRSRDEDEPEDPRPSRSRSSRDDDARPSKTSRRDEDEPEDDKPARDGPRGRNANRGGRR